MWYEPSRPRRDDDEPVAGGVVVGVAATIRQNVERGAILIFRISLHHLPELRTKSIRPLDSFDMRRVRAGVRDVHVAQRKHHQRGCTLLQ